MHLLEKFEYCPMCGSHHFNKMGEKSRKCENCGFELFMNASAAKGTLDLPGGFADAGETAEEGVAREVKEETGLEVVSAKYLFSLPNVYRYCGIDVPTLDAFFECKVRDISALKADDDAAECMWLKPEDIHTEQFGLRSVRWGLVQYLETLQTKKEL